MRDTLLLEKRPAAFLERSAVWLFLAALLVVCALQIALGALPTRIYGHDLFVLLDGAWRVASGQTPCVDFYSGLGVLVWDPLRWALALDGYRADAIGLARAFYTAVLGIWFLLLVRRDRARIPSLVLGFFFLIFISAARPLGEYPTWISHAMFYNRIGYALLFLIILEQLPVSRFQAADAPAPAAERSGTLFWGGLSTGAALACTVLLKVSFVLPGVLLLASGLFSFGVRRKHLLGVLTGGLAAALGALAFLHFQPAAFLRETIALGHARQGMLFSQTVSVIVEEVGNLGFALAAGLVIAIACFRGRQTALKYMFATLVVVGCDVFCRATNAMRGDLPLAAFWSLSGAMLLFSLPARSETRQRLTFQRAVAAMALFPITVPLFAKDLASSADAAYETAVLASQQQPHFDSARLRSWTPLDWQGDDPDAKNANGAPLIASTNDGIRLLQSLSGPNETVSSIAFDNPFSFALGRRPPEGGATWLNVSNNVSTSDPLPERSLIGQPDLLMVQHTTGEEAAEIQTILSLYPDLLAREYSLIGKSQYWSLYRRNR
ncbi:MAG TPA: hypothetical protein VGR96_03655 [Acidobacteriaceae bacterium]|nr:hypothetical protein [Acidobacteriaceae bacterium]